MDRDSKNLDNLEAPAAWRCGTKVPVNVYEGDRPVCQCHDPKDAERMVVAVNSAPGLIRAARGADETVGELLKSLYCKLVAINAESVPMGCDFGNSTIARLSQEAIDMYRTWEAGTPPKITRMETE